MSLKLHIFLLFYKVLPWSNSRIERILEKRIAKYDGGFAYSRVIRKIYREKHGLEIGNGTYGGCWNKSSLWWRNIRIGNYCSFSANISIFTSNHASNAFSTHPILFVKEYGMDEPLRNCITPDDWRNSGLTIGNDVWIGENTVILPSCHSIGDGAIVGAGAIVTKDIPPYAVVAGNPAKILRYRFSPKQIDYLQSTRWWELSKNELALTSNEIQQNLISII